MCADIKKVIPAAKKPEKAEKPRVFPLTSPERGMYLEQKLYPESVSYSLNFVFIINGASAEAVKSALNSIFAAHEAFHSTYGEENGVPVRIVTDKLPEIIEKTAATKEEVLGIIESYAEPLDLCSGIPVRPVLYTAADGELILHLALHHIGFDGGSIKPFLRELTDGLRGNSITAAPIDLSDLYDRETEEARELGLAYYREMFADGIPVCDMPVRGRRPKVHPASDREKNAYLLIRTKRLTNARCRSL